MSKRAIEHLHEAVNTPHDNLNTNVLLFTLLLGYFV